MLNSTPINPKNKNKKSTDREVSIVMENPINYWYQKYLTEHKKVQELEKKLEKIQ